MSRCESRPPTPPRAGTTGWRLAALTVAVALPCVTALAANRDSEDSGDLDLEQLMEIQVTSVAGVARPLQDTPAALYVITAEDIRRRGYRTIPDALRMVPGMNVAQVTSSIWAISARGFNDRFSTKLLVLIDGRAVYNNLFSGVYWDVQDLVLEDVDRIEVIRGPGATLWGANAVNGVINIVTKRARRTQGALVSAGGGDVDGGFGTIRYGGKMGEETYLRVYGKLIRRDNFDFADPTTAMPDEAPDEWDLGSGGFRVDFESNPDTTVTVESRAYSGTIGSPVVMKSLSAPSVELADIDQEVRGGHLLARVDRLASATAGWSVQAYYDHAERERGDFFDEERKTYDVEFRHHLAVGKRNSLIWGVGYRHRRDETEGSLTLSMDPADDSKDLYSGFVQDTILLRDGRVALMLGSKFEDNDFTGFEFQPGIRLAWTPDARRTLWAAVARAVRTPSRGSDNLVLTTTVAEPPAVPSPAPARLLGNPRIDSEKLHAYELGGRIQPWDRLTLDMAAFYNDYDELISLGAPTASPLDVTFSNDTTGEAYGVELAVWWDVAPSWRLSGSYSFLEVDLDGVAESDEETAPRHQANLHSYLDLTMGLELNAAVYYADDVLDSRVDDYTRLDVGLTWRPSSRTELAIWGQNLLESDHVEFIDPFFVVHPIEVERSAYAQLTLRF